MAKYQDTQTGIVSEIGSPELNPSLVSGKTLVSDTTPLGNQPNYQSITSSNLANNGQIKLPTPTPTDYTTTTGMTQAMIDANKKAILDASPGVNNTNDNQSILDYIKNSPKTPSLTEEYNKLYNNPDVIAKQNAYNKSKGEYDTLQAQIAGLDYQANTVIPNQDQQNSTGRGITTGGLAPITASQQRQILLQKAPLQYQALIKQAEVTNNASILNTATTHIDNVFKVYSQDIQNEYTNQKDLRDKIYEYSTAQEKAKLEKLQKVDDRNFELQKIDIQNANSLAKSAQESGQFDIASKLLSLDPKSATYKQDIQNLSSQIKQKSNNEFISGTANQPAGYFDKNTGIFTPISTGKWKTSGVQQLAQSKAKIDQISSVLSGGGMGIGGAVGTSFLTRNPSGFFENLGGIASVIGLPSVLKGTYNKLSGNQQDFIANIEQIRSELNLNTLINAKTNGATFGALSNQELNLLANTATKIGSWAIHEDGNPDKPVIGYNTSESNFKKELDKINNFAKLDYVIKGGDPSNVNIKIMPNGEYWTTNSDGTFTKIK